MTTTVIFGISTLASIYSMSVSPSFPQRLWSGPIILFVMILGNICSNIKIEDRIIKKEVNIVILILIVIFAGNYIQSTLSLKQTKLAYVNRVNSIENQKMNYVVKIPDIIGYSKYDCYTRDGDLNEYYDKWLNTAIAQYYEVDKIIKGDGY